MSESARTYPEALEVRPLERPPSTAVVVPGSKSITNRALVLAAAYSCLDELRLVGALRSEDTEVMVAGLQALGYAVRPEWDQDPPSVTVGPIEAAVRGNPDPAAWPPYPADLYVANSGTTMRFLAALASLGKGQVRIDGNARMRERPIGDLLDALRRAGVPVRSERGNGCPPVVIKGRGSWPHNRIQVRGDVSSQFLSALLMVAPLACREEDLTIEVVGPLVSRPYVDMTVAMMEAWGLPIWLEGNLFRVVPAGIEPSWEKRLHSYTIEPDASAASYFFAAAAITGGRVTVLGLPENSLQGDVRFVDVLADMGCRVERCSSGITVHGRPLRGVDVDMNDISDTVMTLAAVACFAEGPTTIRNVAHIRHKETDRLAALAAELRRVGAEVDEFPDGLKITPRPLRGAEIETYHDHRMAMSMALVGLRVPGVVIKNPACVAKTYPRFFEDVEKLR
jgi:3-phosphoshikimate 1-carboxyvinyltransferase